MKGSRPRGGSRIEMLDGFMEEETYSGKKRRAMDRGKLKG